MAGDQRETSHLAAPRHFSVMSFFKSLTVKVVSLLRPDFRSREHSHKVALLVLLLVALGLAQLWLLRATGGWMSTVGRGCWHLR